MPTPSVGDDAGRISIRKIALASSIGATIEWYDFFLYGVVVSLVFNKLFFPSLIRLSAPCLPTLLSWSASLRAR
jgi:MFS transporter, MHS family, shikimate and dehydroshikimate transport protein